MQENEGLTPLHLSIFSGNIDIIKKLLKSGANKNIKDKKGRTPLDLLQNEAIGRNIKGKDKIEKILMEGDGNLCGQMCIIRTPLKKIEKSNFNIFFFMIIHIIVEFIAFFLILSGKITYN